VLRIIHGSDTFSARELLGEELRALTGGDREQVRWLEGKAATPTEILEACEQRSMFMTNVVVVVEGLLSRFSKDDSRKKPSRGKKRATKTPDDPMVLWEPFVNRAQTLPEGTALFFVDAELKAANPLLKALTPLSEVTECVPPQRDALDRWVRQRVADAGGHINPAAVQRLSMLSGGDLWLLASEIEKLVVYAGGEPVTVEMVDEMISGGPAPSIFMLVDTIVEGNGRLARHRLDDMYQKGLSAGYVFTMVQRQLRIIAQIHEARRLRGAAPSSELSGLHSFALDRATRQAQRLSESDTRRAMLRTLEADRDIKSGVFSDRMALEMLITDLLHAPAA
jgi:DNA polymerase III subunit delta